MRTAPEDAAAPAAETTEDGFLGGAVTLRQPRRGHRSGLEAVLIAAAAPIRAGDTLVDIGAGVGAAGLCALARVPGTQAVLVEGDPDLAALASANVARNGLAERARVAVCDVTRPGAAARAGLAGVADHALANPPFHEPASSRVSPHKKAAHVTTAQALDGWLRFAAAVLRPVGTLTLVHRADALGRVLSACGNRFGDLRILPIHARPDQPASRVIVQARKASRAPLTLLPGLVLHGPQGHRFRRDIDAILRGRAALSLAEAG